MKIDILCGADFKHLVHEVAVMRINAFREFPYLYVGTESYEEHYLNSYLNDPKSILATVKINGILAGISTGIPIVSDSDIVKEAKTTFLANNLDPEEYYYYGEVIIKPEFRSKGITTQLFTAKEAKVKSWGFKNICLLTVDREDNHPLRPVSYNDSDAIWLHLGFEKTKLGVTYSWPTIISDTSVADVNHNLSFWTKRIS